MKWDRPNLDAPHTQRELDEISQGEALIRIHQEDERQFKAFMDAEKGRFAVAVLTAINKSLRDEIASLKAQLADRDYRC